MCFQLSSTAQNQVHYPNSHTIIIVNSKAGNLRSLCTHFLRAFSSIQPYPVPLERRTSSHMFIPFLRIWPSLYISQLLYNCLSLGCHSWILSFLARQMHFASWPMEKAINNFDYSAVILNFWKVLVKQSRLRSQGYFF